MRKITPEPSEVKALRELQGCGLQDAYKQILKRNLQEAVEDARSISDLKEILREVIRRMS